MWDFGAQLFHIQHSYSLMLVIKMVNLLDIMDVERQGQGVSCADVVVLSAVI